MTDVRLADYDPLDPAVIKNPFPYYPLLQREAPVYRVPKHGFYVISRYDDALAVLQNWQDFTTTSGPGPAFTSSPVAAVLQSDPPVHTRLRSIISKAFTPRAVAACEPLVEAYAHECMDHILARGRADLVEEYAIPIPVVVIAELLGVPRETGACSAPGPTTWWRRSAAAAARAALPSTSSRTSARRSRSGGASRATT